MRLVIQENADLVTDWAARYVLKRVKDFNPGPEKFFVLGLPTGKPICFASFLKSLAILFDFLMLFLNLFIHSVSVTQQA